ncbi:MAG TPA: glycosyl hydrolase, partial [Luteolibacter sp.]|nr:glycosyl hydrolase [Luteolibacter sp.]
MQLHPFPRGIAAALLFLTASPWLAPSAAAQLSRKDFADPPLQARPGALWTWLNGHVDRRQITRELEEMKAKGMRGAIIWDMGSISDPAKLIPEGPEFLGPESLKSIHHAIDEAGRLGLELGLVAASSWNAGGPWIDPADASKKLLWSETIIEGGREVEQQLALPEKALGPHREVAVMAIPASEDKQAIDPNAMLRIDERLDAQGKLSWKAPAGKWRVLRFIQDNTGQKLMCPSPKSSGLLIDHLSAPATEIHTEHMLNTLMRGRKDYGALKSLMLDSYEVKSAFDWTPDFVAQFTRRMGYDPTPWLPVLAGQTIADADQSARFRHDYGVVVSDLIIENHYARTRELVNRRGLILLAEAGHGGHARVDPLKALGASDVPMGEYWNFRKNWVTKEAASAANLYGKTLVNCESMTGWRNWQDGPAVYKRITDIALCAGLNQITFHTFAHNPPEAGLPGNAYHAGEHFNVNLTWWNQAGPMLAALSRSSHMLQQGRFVADVCAYYGDDAPNLVPARRIDPRDKPLYGQDKCLHCGRPLPVDLCSLGQSHDYDFLNEEILVHAMEWRDGRLRLPSGMEYRLLVLPERESISLAALRKIGQLVKAGATVVGPKPQRSNSLVGYPACDEEVRKLAAEIWGD